MWPSEIFPQQLRALWAQRISFGLRRRATPTVALLLLLLTAAIMHY